MQPIKFLILRFSSIGDVVLTTPVIRGLKQQVAHAEIHYFTKPAFREILEVNPYIDRIHVLREDLNEQIRELKEEQFDYVIDLHKNIRTRRIISGLKVISFTFDKLNLKKWIYVNFKVNRLPDRHIVDRYREAVDVFDVQDDGTGLDYFIPDKDSVDAAQWASPFRDGYIGFAIGAMHDTKKLTPDKMISIIDRIKHPVVLLGGKEDHATGEQIRQSCKTKVYNACGEYTINQSASLVRQARLIITHDTGLMHIAAAFRKRIITIWGNTVPEFGMYPYRPHPDSAWFEIRDLRCRPCSKLGYKRCPKRHFRCIRDIDDQRVADKALKLLNRVDTE
ncbi:MAG: glycosyltransferase family 9 protein [Bacteroidales bacterium]|nr:glycosyltransferase family 9 protein [Bacteroidales bacterium]